MDLLKTAGWGFTKNKVELTDLSRLTPEEIKRVSDYWSEEDQAFLEDNEFMIRIGTTLDYYDPLSGPPTRLWNDYYNIVTGDNKSALGFYKKYGPTIPTWIGSYGPFPEETPKQEEAETGLESLGVFFHHQKTFRLTVNLYKHRNNETYLKRLLANDLGAKKFFYDFKQLRGYAGRRVADVITHNLHALSHNIEYRGTTWFDETHNIPGDYFYPSISYTTLLQAIYWQFRNTVLEGKELVDCKNPDCDAVFIPDHGNQEFHSPTCKQKFNDKKRPPKKPKTRKGAGDNG